MRKKAGEPTSFSFGRVLAQCGPCAGVAVPHVSPSAPALASGRALTVGNTQWLIVGRECGLQQLPPTGLTVGRLCSGSRRDPGCGAVGETLTKGTSSCALPHPRQPYLGAMSKETGLEPLPQAGFKIQILRTLGFWIF